MANSVGASKQLLMEIKTLVENYIFEFSARTKHFLYKKNKKASRLHLFNITEQIEFFM